MYNTRVEEFMEAPINILIQKMSQYKGFFSSLNLATCKKIDIENKIKLCVAPDYLYAIAYCYAVRVLNRKL